MRDHPPYMPPNSLCPECKEQKMAPAGHNMLTCPGCRHTCLVLTWMCHICTSERPDDRISVRSFKDDDAPCTYNVRYCNDRPYCPDYIRDLTPAGARAIILGHQRQS